LEEAGPVMRAFLNSRYVEYITRHHYEHHRDASTNFNLVPGADLAQGYTPTKVDTIVALRNMRAFY
jgi:hypothetical protein